MPVTTNQFPQAHYYRTGHLLTAEDRVPHKIVFDMTRPQPQPPAYGPAPGYAYPPYYYGAPYYYGPGVNFYFGPGYRRW